VLTFGHVVHVVWGALRPRGDFDLNLSVDHGSLLKLGAEALGRSTPTGGSRPEEVVGNNAKG